MFIFWKVLISFIVPNIYRKLKLHMLAVAYSLLHSASFTWLVCFAKYFNPFQPGAAFHIETKANQMTGFYVKCNYSQSNDWFLCEMQLLPIKWLASIWNATLRWNTSKVVALQKLPPSWNLLLDLKMTREFL